jgi:4-alpha-glucanotransferase
MRDYLKRWGIGFGGCEDAPWALIELALASRCRLAVFPLQDVLGLGSEARMNQPARPEGNWAWRYLPGMLGEEPARGLFRSAERYRRLRRG